MFVLVFEFGDGDFGGGNMTPWEIGNPNRTRNGNDSMKTTVSQLRIFKVMLAGRGGKKLRASIIQMLTKPVGFL
jgi:hypothetical protein